ncbi:MAG: ribonuclease H-like domain-containing protein [Candidatus Dormibacteria bacterium]
MATRLGVEVAENDFGQFLVREEVVASPISALCPGAVQRVSGVDLSALDPARLCFFDTETTGLSGGVGTQVFLAALAWRVPSGLLLRQYLLADPSLERAMLVQVRKDLAASEALVTYNGRAFDMPLLENRLLLARLPGLAGVHPHLDLLHPVRRMFKARLGSCSLGQVEALVLGRDRGDDIAGHLIPEAYFAFLRSRRPGLLRAVLAHNRQDVASLSLLLDHIGFAVENPGRLHPLDRFSLARCLETRGFAAPALELYAALWGESEGGWDGELWPGAWTPVELAYVTGMRLATGHRRLGSGHLGEAILKQLWLRHPRPWEAGIMLAKHLEHRRRDRRAALEVVAAALDALEGLGPRDGREERFASDLRHRRARLEKGVSPAAA